MNSSLFPFCLLLALTYLVFAADPTGSVSFKANYILTDNSLYPNGQIPGTVYYRFDTSKPQDSRVRFEHELYVGSTKETIVELEDFSKKLSFKICGKTCEGYQMSRTAQRWWYQQGDAKQEGDKIGDFTHYTRSLSDYGVSDLWLKNEDLPSNTLYLKKIVFNTGRTLTFVDSTYSTVDYNNDKFDPNAGGVTCSTETCRTFMDLIFVLDSSASVGSSNWNTMVKFVQDVVKQTDISAESGAVSVVGFGGTTCNKYQSDCKGTWHSNYIDTADGGWQTAPNYEELDGAYDVYKNGVLQMRCGYTKKGSWWSDPSYTFYPENKRDFCKKVLNKERGYRQSDGYTFVDVGDDSYALINGQVYGLYNRCEGDFKNCTYGGNPFISKTYVDLTYMPMDDLMKEIQNNVKYAQGDTCQALGLIKAMDVLNRHKRTDPVDGSVPQRIIIAMTDGDDHCASETKKYAEILRNEYNATVIEVSIGLEHNYDKELLQNISSHTNGIPSYFDVSDFNALQEHIHEMVSTVCQVDPSDVGGSCDKKCKGFCGCGSQCFCPTCDSSLNNECHTYTCESDNKVTAGCVDNPTVCNDNRYCSDDECVVGTGCVYRNRTCGENLKKCQVQKCSESLQGQCGDIESLASLCPPPPPMHGCYEAICDPAHAGSDSEYGCYYKYKCVGELPVVYDSDSKYVSGCYRYTCDNNTDQCATANVCDEMSAADKCVNYVCNHDEGKCVPDESTRVTCPEINGCRTESKCNSATGLCDMTYVTPADCKKRFKDEAKNHIDDWFSGNADSIEPYYNCGEHKCDENAEGATGEPTMNQTGHCLFVQDDQESCGVCNGGYTDQPTFDSCEQEAVEKHNDQPDICFSSTCTSTSSVTSTCVFTNVTCEPKPCMDVVCNPTSLQCEYHWTQEYVNAQYNVTACSELICEDDKPKIVDISKKKCVGENNASVPVCQLYDRCDAYAGCIYKEKCVKDEVCTTMRCDETTNECVKEPVKCQESDNVCYNYECSKNSDKCEVVLKTVEEACGETDLCHEYTCNVIENKCILNEIPYPNGTDKCHNYTCHNSTGEWTVVEKCDDGNICTVDTCTPYDGSCTNFQRDCLEINMTGFGSCFGRACSKARKNGCFRKVYENSYFDECGNCIRGYSAGDSGLTESEASDCKKALSFQEEAAVISAGILAAIIAACVIGAIAVSTAGTLATKELIKRARAAKDSGAHDNPLFEDDGQEMENPTFVGDE